MVLSWTRRARGAWLWRDSVDAPLGEAAEQYEIAFGTPDSVYARWELSEPAIEIDAAQLASLLSEVPTGAFRVRQIGDHGISLPLTILVP